MVQAEFIRPTLYLDLGSLSGAEFSAGRYWLLSDPNERPLGEGRLLTEHMDPRAPEEAVAEARRMAHACLPKGGTFASRRTRSGSPSGWMQAYSFYDGGGRTIAWNQAWLLACSIRSIVEVHHPKTLLLRGGGRDHAELCESIAVQNGLGWAREKPQSIPFKAWILASLGERLKHGLRAVNALLSTGAPQPSKDILFFGMGLQRDATGGWSHGNFTEIQAQLSRRGVAYQTVFLWNRFQSRRFAREAANANHFALESLYSFRDWLRVLGWALLPHPFRWMRKLTEAPETVRSEGLGPLFKRKWAHFIRWREDESDLLVRTFIRTLKRIRPRVVVMVDEADSQGLALVYACKVLGIPSVALQHGVLHPQHFGYVHDPRDHEGEHPFPLPDVTLVYGPYFLDVLKFHGHFPADAIQVTGGARFESMLRQRADASATERLGLDVDSRVVLLTTQPLPNRSERLGVLNATCKALQGIPNVLLLLKPHPNEWDFSMMHQAIQDAAPLQAQILPGARLDQLYRIASVSISQSSTTLIESLLLGCPAITLNLTGWPELLPYAESGACLGVSCPGDLQGVIQDVLQEGPAVRAARAVTPRFLASMLGPLDGQATDRAVEEIMGRLSGVKELKKPIVAL